MSTIRRTVYLPDDVPGALPLVDAGEPTEEPRPYWVHDSREPLACVDAPRLNRKVGVLASRPYHHHGMNAEYVDVRRETVTVNTHECGYYYPAEETVDRIRAATEATIADLDRVIVELTQHRDRLAGAR